MREPFPYESNGLLLSKFLVPEPISQEEWDRSVEAWTKKGRRGSLLQSLIGRGVLEEGMFLQWMRQAIGCEIATGRMEKLPGNRCPEGELLERYGFIVLSNRPAGKVVAGGPDLPPELGKYLGSSAGEWKWVLHSPCKGEISDMKAEEQGVDPDGLIHSATGIWLEELLLDCRARGAADLHLERSAGRLRVRMRTAGGMHEVGAREGEHADKLIRLLKTWTGLPTTETSLPADGRLTRRIAGRIHTFRASLIKTIDGESIVLRQLGEESDVRSLRELQVPEELRQAMQDLVQLDRGMILFTGPTGSGKTTTLFGLLSLLRNQPLKIMTIEDPVEYEMPHLTQSQVDEANGWTFDRAIRAYMRQDPDVIVAGEIRDRDSAEAACRAALTGHSVLTTLHARDEEMAVKRLRGWDIPESILQETVRLVVNQRLGNTVPGGPRRARYSWTRPFASV